MLGCIIIIRACSIKHFLISKGHLIDLLEDCLQVERWWHALCFSRANRGTKFLATLWKSFCTLCGVGGFIAASVKSPAELLQQGQEFPHWLLTVIHVKEIIKSVFDPVGDEVGFQPRGPLWMKQLLMSSSSWSRSPATAQPLWLWCNSPETRAELQPMHELNTESPPSISCNAGLLQQAFSASKGYSFDTKMKGFQTEQAINQAILRKSEILLVLTVPNPKNK